ncbi:MAG: hypothetical protein ACR2KP_00360 [Egibacteraceae bacterium]
MDDVDAFDDWSDDEGWDPADAWEDTAEAAGWDAPADDDEDLDEEALGEIPTLDDGDGNEDLDEDPGEGRLGNGGGLAADAAGESDRQPRMSAWEFGMGAAVAGWLLDRQADRIVEAVRQAPPLPSVAPGAPPLRGPAPAWWRVPAPPLDASAAPLEPGAVLEPSRLASTIRHRALSGDPLGLEARLHAGGRRRLADPSLDPAALLVTVVVTDLTPQRPIWVMFEERPGGFATARLLPVFDGHGPPGRAYCFVDNATAAMAVLIWGLERYGLALPDFSWSGGF